MNKSINKIVLAYSGGLDTSAMLLWLKETYGCEVICYTADVGQGDELTGLDEKAKATGASKLYVEDLREEFVKDFVWTAVKANALYEGVYLLGTSLARPIIANARSRSHKKKAPMRSHTERPGRAMTKCGLS
jgi:argininosuccinate synthase